MDSTQMIPPSDQDRTRIVGPASGDRTAMASTKALSIECISGNQYALSSDLTREHVLVTIRSIGAAVGGRMPMNLCLIIDRSGSMEGPPLDFAKQACAYVVDLLQPNDVLSIVTFEEQIEVLMPARRVVNRDLVKQHIYRIEPGNTTNIYDGIVAGCSQIASVPAGGYVNRALLLTDGEPTAGIKDFSSIVGQVAEQKSRGITITALGFGGEYNEELLGGIARRSGGNYYYITRPDLIPEIFRRELESLMTVVARNLRLQVYLPRWVQVRQIYGQQPVYSGKMAEVTLADLERGSAETAIIELGLDPRPSGKYRVARIDLIYDDSVSGRQETITCDAVMEFTTDSSLVEQGTNPQVQGELEVALASRALEKTVMGMRTQQISPAAAVQELERTKTILLQQGKTAQAQDVQNAINDIKGGAAAEKTLIGTIYNLDTGKQ